MGIVFVLVVLYGYVGVDEFECDYVVVYVVVFCDCVLMVFDDEVDCVYLVCWIGKVMVMMCDGCMFMGCVDELKGDLGNMLLCDEIVCKVCMFVVFLGVVFGVEVEWFFVDVW